MLQMSACRPRYRRPFQAWCYFLLGAPSIAALAQTSASATATIDINTTVTTPISPGFSGVSTDLGFPVEFWDYRFNALASTIGFGWLRFPGGTSSDIYNWQTGEDEQSWYSQFPPTSGIAGDQTTIALVAGRGGAKLIDAANRSNLLGAPLIICVNGYTDTAASAGQLAAYVKANQIQVAGWELSNEPYLYSTFFATATAYLNAMKPYRDAIKAVLPNAIVAVFVSDQAHANAATDAWNVAVAAYPNKYWDAITYHHYPPQSSGAFAQWMADEAAVLATRTSAVPASLAAQIGPAGVKFLNTEFDPSIPNDASTGASSITCGTVWGGIYSAEYIMRMSAVPSVLHVGPSEISYNAGVFASNGHQSQVEAAAAAGAPINTLTLNFGFYVSAQGAGMSVLNGVISRAVESNQTVVTGGAMVPATGITPIPALYAMSYSNAQGGLSVVITNKSATPHQVMVRINGSAASGTIPLRFISAADPSTANTATSQNTISIQNASSSNPITVPPYSVLRADLTAPPVAAFVNSASFQPGPVAPQQLVTAFFSGFGSQTGTAPGQPLPTMLQGTTIAITDSEGTVSKAPIYFVSPTQASFLIPNGVAPGAATVKIANSTTSLTGSLTVATVSPGLYSANGNGAGVAAALAERVTASGDATPLTVFSCQSGVPISCLSTPLSPGNSTGTVYVSLYGTGIRGAGTVQAYVAGQPVPLLYAGPQGQYQGLDQVNISLPSSLAGMGEVSVYLSADGNVSNMITVNIQ
jgi:uncharacterized protein (TIGR03437 family)